MEKEQILKNYFGYESFREGQGEIIDRILSGSDVLAVMPTGAGKSVCYQIPALLFDGVTIVISPLISLMSDQVAALTQMGVKAAYLNGSLTLAQQNKVMENIAAGMYKIVYVAPERLGLRGFIETISRVKISLVTIDESHCVSQWGHDFRPSYLRIADFIAGINPRPTIAAFTATATAAVREDIIRSLRLENPYIRVTGFNRENLYFEVRHPKNKYKELVNILEDHKGQAAIIYCSSRKKVEDICDALNDSGYSAARYHAGMDAEERAQNQDDFIYDRRRIMVATNAFGMGIDKPDVYLVVHYNMPKDIESYYQEAGRAGRDGGRSDCILLYGAQDVSTARYLINQDSKLSEEDEETLERVRQAAFKRLDIMTRYCQTTECLRGYILKYFGEKPPAHCGNCGSCLANYETEDITVEAQKIVSCVYRIKRRGINAQKAMLADILHGGKDKRILALGLDTISTYGIMSDERVSRIRAIIDILIFDGYLVIDSENYNAVMPTSKSKEILDGKKITARMAKETKKSSKSIKTGDEQYNEELFKRLRRVRARRAAVLGVPAYVVFSDASLKDMCRKMPITDRDFLSVSGVGEMKRARYGREFMTEIRNFMKGR